MRLILALCLVPTAASADPRDRAVEELAAGRGRAAVSELQRALSEDETHALRCLLGQVHHGLGEHERALEVLALVPADAECARGAAFVSAQAALALGRSEEAAARYDTLGSEVLGEARGSITARRLSALAERLMERDPPLAEQASAVLTRALELPLSQELELTMARRLADIATAHGVPGEAAISVLSPQIGRDVDTQDRLRLAALLGGTPARTLLERLPEDPELLATRLSLSGDLPFEARMRLVQALITGWPDAPQTAKARRELGLAMASAGRLVEARELLSSVAEGFDAHAAEAAWVLLGLSVRAGETQAALDGARDLLQRFPNHAHRTDAERLVTQQRFRLARERAEVDPEASVQIFDELVGTLARDPMGAEAAFEAAMVVLDGGDEAAALERLERLLARWPGSASAERALSAGLVMRATAEGDEAGLEWVRRHAVHAQSAADSLIAASEEPLLGVHTPDDVGSGRIPEVTVRSRNIDEVEVSLHKVHTEAYLESGGRVWGLEALDIDVIKPDMRFEHEVPEGPSKVARSWQLPVPVPGPGLYAVTVATRTRKARAILMVSDTQVVVHRVGEQVRVAVHRGGVPVGGARVLVSADGMHRTVTNADGYAVLDDIPATGALAVEAASGPVIMDLPAFPSSRGTDPPTVQVELDRSAYRPGDRVAFRMAAPPAQAAGTWTVWMKAAQPTKHTFEASPEGTISGELVVPIRATGGRDWGANTKRQDLMVIPPWTHEAQSVASVVLADEVPQQRRIRVRMVGPDARIEVLEPDGRPAVGVPVAWGDGATGVTDRTGGVTVRGPAAGVPWALTARIRGAPTQTSAQRAGPLPSRFSIRTVGDRLSADEDVVVQIRGEGTARLRLSRQVPVRPVPASVVEPWATDIEEGFQVVEPAEADAWTSSGLLRTQRSVSRDVRGEVDLNLGRLEPGHYVVQAMDGDLTARSGSLSFTVGDVPRVKAPAEVGPGAPLTVRVVGQPALVTVLAGEQALTRFLDVGGRMRLDVQPDWPEEVRVVARFADGSEHERVVAVHNEPHVSVKTQEEAGRWRVEAQVLDHVGKPRQAEVVLRIVDPELESWSGHTATLRAGPLHTAQAWQLTSAVGLGLRDGGWSTQVAAAFLQEEAQLAERAKASVAKSGRLSDNLLTDLMGVDVPLQEGMGGMGLSGHGSGGGGFGRGGLRGSGRPSVRGGVGSRGQALLRPQPGERARILWAVARTDAQGRVSASVPIPAGRGDYRVEAIAVSGGLVGVGEAWVSTMDRPTLILPELGLAGAAAIARPEAAVVNGTERPFEGELRLDGRVVPVSVPAGEHVVVPLGTIRPGHGSEVQLHADGLVDARPLEWALDPWHGAGASQVITVAVGPGGGPPAEWLAMQRDPRELRHPDLAAYAARDVMALLPHLRGEARERALRRLEGLIAELPTGSRPYGSVHAAAYALAALAEARPILGYDDAGIESLGAGVEVDAASRDERVAWVWARATAELPVSDAAVARLLRDAETMEPEVRSQLARALLRIGRADAAKPLISGEGPHAVLARRDLGGKASVRLQDVPMPGDAARADYLRALEPPPRRRRRTRGQSAFDVVVGGRIVGRIDPALGGVVTAVADGDLGELPVSAWVGRSRSAESTIVPRAALLPVLPDRLIARVNTSKVEEGDVEITCAPCEIAPGEGLRVRGDLARARVPGGLRLVQDPLRRNKVLVGVVPGTYVVEGISTEEGRGSLSVEVGAPSALPVSQEAAVALARVASGSDQDPERWLGSRERLDAWQPDLRGAVADLRFTSAVRRRERVVEAFEDLRDLVPEASLPLSDVAAVARAYAADRPERSLEIWRTGIGAAFLEEAGLVDDLPSVIGELASIQILREVASRYPRVDVVEQALFDLPDRVLSLDASSVPTEARVAGVTDTDFKLMASAWNREFLALHPDSELVPHAGLRLSATLLDLGANQRAATWARRVATAHPDHPLVDRLHYVEGLALSSAGQRREARSRLRSVANSVYDDVNGEPSSSVMREDASLALARLREAQGDRAGARARYRALSGTFDEADASVANLQTRVLSTAPTLVVRGSDGVELDLTVAGVSEISVRAYALDLRTLFLRDGGVQGAADVQVSGVAPVWSGSKRVRDVPFERRVRMGVPVRGPGAFLVQIEAAGQHSNVLVVRTDLEVDADDAGDARRLTVRLRGRPAEGVEVRALGRRLVVAETDARGVAIVPAFAPSLVISGPHVAFTRPAASKASGTDAKDELAERLEAELQRLATEERAKLDYVRRAGQAEVPLKEL